MNAHLTFVHALSPLHAGTGQGSGVIDLPIAREKATGLPFLPGSSLKGALRSRCPEKERNLIFGSDTNSISADSNAASPAQFSDQRLLLLPVRSLAGTFAWVTSPYILRRFARDIEDARRLYLQRRQYPTLQKQHNARSPGRTAKLRCKPIHKRSILKTSIWHHKPRQRLQVGLPGLESMFSPMIQIGKVCW